MSPFQPFLPSLCSPVHHCLPPHLSPHHSVSSCVSLCPACAIPFCIFPTSPPHVSSSKCIASCNMYIIYCLPKQLYMQIIIGSRMVRSFWFLKHHKYWAIRTLLRLVLDIPEMDIYCLGRVFSQDPVELQANTYLPISVLAVYGSLDTSIVLVAYGLCSPPPSMAKSLGCSHRGSKFWAGA